jgi:hypothetical protein
MGRTNIAALVIACAPAFAQSVMEKPVPVTVENFRRAESDMYFAKFVKDGGFGKFTHHRELPLENTGVRPNRDTLYSIALFDLDAGPVSITLPDAGTRFMTMLVIDEDHYASNGRIWQRNLYARPKQDRHEICICGGENIGRSSRSRGFEARPRVTGCDQSQPEECR